MGVDTINGAPPSPARRLLDAALVALGAEAVAQEADAVAGVGRALDVRFAQAVRALLGAAPEAELCFLDYRGAVFCR